MIVYVRTKDGIYPVQLDEVPLDRTVTAFRLQHARGWDKPLEISEETYYGRDSIEEVIRPGDIIFYYDFHSQSEQCMYVTNPIFLDLPVTKLLIPVGDDYICVAKAEHKYKVLDHMKHVIKKGKLESIYKGA